MYYLDRELADYQNEQESCCSVCGEYNDENWQCDCCQECEETTCTCEEEDIYLGI